MDKYWSWNDCVKLICSNWNYNIYMKIINCWFCNNMWLLGVFKITQIWCKWFPRENNSFWSDSITDTKTSFPIRWDVYNVTG